MATVKRIMNFPFEVEVVDPEECRAMTKILQGYVDEFVRIGPKKYFCQKSYLSEAANIYNFPLRSDDTFVVTFPKSGTTLSQELTWLLCNNLDYKAAQLKTLNARFPFLEISALDPVRDVTEIQKISMKETMSPLDVKEIGELPSPRFIKSHLPLSLLPPTLLDISKVIYVSRDPRDVAVSLYYHHKLMKLMPSNIEFKTFWNIFVSDNIFWGPYFQHVLEGWDKRNHPNILFMFYEEMIKDMRLTVQNVAKFLNKTLSEDQVNVLADHLNIKNFKKNKSINLENLQKLGVFASDGAFIRKGKSGEWRDYFDEEMTAQADAWIAKNLRNTDFRFPHC